MLSYFAQQAAAQQVEFSVKAQLPEYTGVADPDLAVLFGNLLENALTACMQEASPRIVVRITADAHTLRAAVDNTFTGAVRRTTRRIPLHQARRTGAGDGLRPQHR